VARQSPTIVVRAVDQAVVVVVRAVVAQQLGTLHGVCAVGIFAINESVAVIVATVVTHFGAVAIAVAVLTIGQTVAVIVCPIGTFGLNAQRLAFAVIVCTIDQAIFVFVDISGADFFDGTPTKGLFTINEVVAVIVDSVAANLDAFTETATDRKGKKCHPLELHLSSLCPHADLSHSPW
jgi:hypothetical protein